MEGLEVKTQCWYLNWILKDIEEGHVNFDQKAWTFKKTEKHKACFRYEKGPVWLD